MFEYDCIAANEMVIVISAAADNFLNRLPLQVMAQREKSLLPAWIYFADEALETQRLKEELHSLVLVCTAVWQKKGR